MTVRTASTARTARTARTGGEAVAPRRAVRLHSRAHIDLLRVAASLCRS